MSNAMQIAKTIALPGRNQPMRMPSFPALERTATMAFNAAFALNVPAGGTNVMLTRQAYYPMWYGTPVTAAANSTGSYGVVLSTTIVPAIGQNSEYTVEVAGNYIDYTFGFNGTVTAAKPAVTNAVDNGGGYINFTKPIIGIDSGTAGSEWLYCPSGSYLALSISKGTNIVATGTITVERWQGPGDIEEYILPGPNITFNILAGNNNAATVPWLMTENAWLRVRSMTITTLTDGTAHDFGVYMGIFLNPNAAPVFTPSGGGVPNAGSWAAPAAAASGTYFLPVAVSAEFDNSKIPWCGTRTSALSALFTNTTKVLNKEGTVLWGRLNPNVYDVWNDITQAKLQTLHPAEKAFLGLEEGTYTYAPPSTDLTIFRNHTLKGPSATPDVVLPIYRLDNDSMVNAGFFNDPDGGTSLAVNLDWHIEFRTSSTLFNIGVSSLLLESLHAAQIGLLKAGFFYSNVDHVAVMSAIIRAIGSLNPILRVAAPLAKGLLGASSVALSRKSARPRATSLAASTHTRSQVRLPSRVRPPRNRKAKSRTKSTANSVANRMMGLNAAMRKQRLPRGA